jgi:hypothetical protein
MEMSDPEVDRILAQQARDRDQRERTARIADRYIGRDGSEPANIERKAKAVGLTVIDGDKAEPKSGTLVLDKTYALIGRFVCYPSDHARVAHTLWIVHTHLMDRWDSTPRLFFSSAEPASGKSRALEVTELLVPNPMTAVNVTPAYLFRKVGAEEGATILFDEIDTVFGPKAKENEEIRGLLNAGHRKGAVAGRCVARGQTVMTEEIPAYAAVAMAGLGWLPDTIMTRSVLIRMRRRNQGESVEPFRRRVHQPDGDRVRQLIENWTELLPAEITWPDLPPEIQDRDADVWEALIAVADLAGGTWPARARAAAVALVAEAKDAEPSLGVRLLADLRTVFGSADELPSKAILNALHAIEEAPWTNLKGKPLDERGLAHRLRQYGIRSKTIRVGAGTPKGYTRADFVDAWDRYLPGPSPARSATSATNSENQALIVADSVADVADVVADRRAEKPSKCNVVADVADVADLAGGGEAKCAQCGHAGDLKEVWYGELTAQVHAHCQDAWVAARDDSLSIPSYLDRRGELSS